ncbi:MAG TPA: hypothetical protein ENI75_03755, partial [Mizugakiibacter sp.]|nr:hypothetical protein [Mizugakiibacter sp.]
MKPDSLSRRAGRHALALALTLALPGAMSVAAAHDKVITLIQLSDVHGNIAPHPGAIKKMDGSERWSTNAGGMAKNKTLIDRIRADNPNNLLLGVGDTTHGTAEVLFTVGDAIMPVLNSFGLDAYTPGNWEFGYGPAVFRNRFASFGPKPPLPGNIQVMANAFDGPGVTAATFPSLAINLYNDTDTAPLPPQLHNKPVLPASKVFTVDGVKIGVIGITAAIVPQQAQVLSIGLRFTQGVDELPAAIANVQAQGATVVVVLSELGLPQNLEIGRRFRDIDVILSAHTHETTLKALVANRRGIRQASPNRLHRVGKNATVVVETTEDVYLGRLDMIIDNGRFEKFVWNAIPVDETVPEDPATKALVDIAEAPFIGATTVRHTFMPGGYCPANNCGNTAVRGLQLVDSLDTVVGHTDVTMHRDDVLEDEINNFIADAFYSVTNLIVPTGVDMSMTNGFRFGSPVLAASDVPPGSTFPDGRQPGDITLRDLYDMFPITPAFVVANFSGLSVQRNLEEVLSAVFNANPFLQRGGWYMGLGNMTQKIDLTNRPFSSSGGRIVETMIDGQKLDLSKRYTFASCYPQGDPIDRVCRTFGGVDHQFFELANPDDYSSGITLVPPRNATGIIQGPRIKQVAPDR